MDFSFSLNPQAEKWIKEYNTVINDSEYYVEVFNFLNWIEAFALYLISGVCDEQLAFRINGRAFCDLVNDYYPIIVYNRRKDLCSYQPIIELYDVWNNRLEKERLEHEAASAEQAAQSRKEAAAALSDKKITPIGTD